MAKDFGQYLVNIADVPYVRESTERVLTGFPDLDFFNKGIEVGLTEILGQTNCVDCDTEYFNGSEWKKISEYTDGEKVLQFTQDQRAELVIPIAYHKTACDTLTLMQNGRKSINQCLSDNHKFIYRSKKSEKIMAVKFADIKERIPSVAEVITAFNFDSFGDFEIDEWLLRLFIAVSADGHFPKNNSTNYCQVNLKHQYKKDRLEMLLAKCGIAYRKVKNNPRDQAFDTYTFYPPEKIKEFPKTWYSMTKRCFEIIYDEVFKWDGEEERQKVYRTIIKNNADFIQFVCSALGKRTSIHTDMRLGGKFKHYCYTVRSCGGNDCYIAMKGSRPISFTDYKTKDGFMYCFTVPSGMLVLRRENAINITGNCGKSILTSSLIGRAIDQHYKVGVFAGEHSLKTYKQLLYQQNAKKGEFEIIPFHDANGNDTNIADWFVNEKAEARIAKKFDGNLFLFNVEKDERDIDTLIGTILYGYKEHGIRFWVIDNLMEIDNKASNQWQEQTGIGNKLRNVFVQNGLFGVLVMHTNKSDVLRVNIRDAFGSSNITNKGYRIWVLYRKDYMFAKQGQERELDRIKRDLATNGFDYDQCDGFIDTIKTKGNRNGIIGIVYDSETKTYKQAPKISQTEADKIYKRTVKQESVDNIFDDMEYVDEQDDLPF